MIASVHSGGFPILPFMVLVAIIIVGIAFTVGIALVWDKEPWWRAFPKPSRQYRNAKEQVKIWKLEQKHPEAFPNGEIMKEEA